MARAGDESTGAPTACGASVPAETWLKDCWLIEVMPPTWAWAYRRLLGSGGAERKFTDRVA